MNQIEAKEYFFKKMRDEGMTDNNEIEGWWNVYMFQKGFKDTELVDKPHQKTLPQQFEDFCNKTPLFFPNGIFVCALMVIGIIGFFALFIWK